MRSLRAFNGDFATKQFFVDRVRAHVDANEIIPSSSVVWSGTDPVHGSVIGATLHGTDMAEYESALGIPAHLARLHEVLFNMLAVKQFPKPPTKVVPHAHAYPVEWLQAIPVGAELGPVTSRFIHRLLLDEVKDLTAADPAVVACIEAVAALHGDIARGRPPLAKDWAAVRVAAIAATDAAEANALKGIGTRALTSIGTAVETLAWAPSDDETGAAVAVDKMGNFLFKEVPWRAAYRNAFTQAQWDMVEARDRANDRLVAEFGRSDPAKLRDAAKILPEFIAVETPEFQAIEQKAIFTAANVPIPGADRRYEALMQALRDN